jgi:hypothetical protein
MAPASHQTARLTRGRHLSPDDGVCVMELASMLSGEPFSDQPRSVCPVIGSFLRTYNDLIDDDRRQDLYAYATRVVGTRSSRPVERRRAALALRWRDAPTREAVFARSTWRFGRSRDLWAARQAGKAAARSVMPDAHRCALAFVDRMLAVGAEERDRDGDTRELASAPRTA